MADSLNTIPLPENRTDLEILIEAAIARLDDIEPDPDLEPDEDGEPQLGAPEARAGTWNGLYPEAFTDTHEADDCDLEDSGDNEADSDREPSLGSLERFGQQNWSFGGADDCEEDDDREMEQGNFTETLVLNIGKPRNQKAVQS